MVLYTYHYSFKLIHFKFGCEQVCGKGLLPFLNVCLFFNSQIKQLRGGVTQWVERLTHDRWIPVSREFEPHQRPLLFP